MPYENDATRFSFEYDITTQDVIASITPRRPIMRLLRIGVGLLMLSIGWRQFQQNGLTWSPIICILGAIPLLTPAESLLVWALCWWMPKQHCHVIVDESGIQSETDVENSTASPVLLNVPWEVLKENFSLRKNSAGLVVTPAKTKFWDPYQSVWIPKRSMDSQAQRDSLLNFIDQKLQEPSVNVPTI